MKRNAKAAAAFVAWVLIFSGVNSLVPYSALTESGSLKDLKTDSVDFQWARFFVILTIIAYFFTAGSDPGFVSVDSDAVFTSEELPTLDEEPPSDDDDSRDENTSDDDDDDDDDWEETARLLSHGGPGTFRGAALRVIAEDVDEALDERLSFVPTSLIPPRTKYDRVSKKFVAKFDHHCGILATTIGERNHFRFWLFLQVCVASVAFATYVAHSGFHDTLSYPAHRWISENGHALVVFVLDLMVLTFLGGFLVFHTFLLSANISTYEFLRAHKISYLKGTEDFDLPFSRGLLSNWKFHVSSDPLLGCLRKSSKWKPKEWKISKGDKNSTDVCANPWENKYFRLC